MSEYPSLDALLQDAQLRLDRYGASAGLIVVEGPDDKRLLCNRTIHRQQVLVAGSRKPLLAAHSLARSKGMEGLVFLTDCDYEVARGNLAPAENLVITHHVDIEADLMDLFGFDRLATELVPQALSDDGAFERTVTALRERSVAFADILGKIRRVALEHSCTIDTSVVRHHRYRQRYSCDIDIPRLVRTLVQNSPDCPIPAAEFAFAVSRISSDYDNCNGHDLAAAVNHVLREDFAVRGQSPESIEKLLRVSASDDDIRQLKLAGYIRRWETQSGRRVLKP